VSLLDALTKTLVEQYAKQLNDQEQVELLEALEVVAHDQKYNKFKNFFPDTGEYRRELYPKHIEFFNAGGEYIERAFIAGNRCVSPWTFIRMDSGLRRSVEVASSKDATVLSWDGEAQCDGQVSGGILKGIEPMFRFVTDTGEFFDCTRKHRVLTEFGWMQIDQLMSLSSGLHLSQTAGDFLANYGAGGHLGDRPLRLSQDSAQETPPLPGDVPERGLLALSHSDALERISRYNQISQDPYLLTIEDDPCRFSDLFEMFSGPASSTPVLRLTKTHQEFHSRLFEFSSRLQQAILACHGRFSGDLFHEELLKKFHDDDNKLTQLYAKDQALWQLCQTLCPGRGVRESSGDVSRIQTFYPLWHPSLVGCKRIVCVLPLGFQPIIDFTVEKHKCYFSAGVVHHNTGKTEAGAYEITCHATGNYPDWWAGKKFNRPILIWVGGDTATTVRDIIQKKLVGDDLLDMGSGMLPKQSIITEKCKTRRNVPEALEIIKVRHSSGGESTIVLKTYEQGRATWQGTEVDVIWVDEECPMDVYGEGLIRLMTTQGIMLLTFTPLQGVTDLVLSFLDNSQETDAEDKKYVQVVSWDDVPHLTEDIKRKMLASTPPQLREARSKGTPTVGEGLVYPIDPKNVVVDDFPIPMHYKKLYGMDVGWNNTAAVWGAWDADNDVIYVYSEHMQGLVEPVVHAKAIKARGTWIRGEIDPAARGRSQVDGQKLFDIYGLPEARGGLGLKLIPANNAREAGIFAVWERFTSGRLKIFKSCTGVLRELSLYHRDDKGQIVKTNDHRLDSLRYLINAPPSHWQYPQKESGRKVVRITDHMNACT